MSNFVLRRKLHLSVVRSWLSLARQDEAAVYLLARREFVEIADGSWFLAATLPVALD